MLKPGFLALVADPYDVKLLDIIVFDVLPFSDGSADGQMCLAKLTKERNPLYFGFMVSLISCFAFEKCVMFKWLQE